MTDDSKSIHCLSLEDLRREYQLGELTEHNCETNPIVQFERWLKQAQVIELKEPNAMVLATSTPAGRPSARVVLLKEVSENGFVFYTNYESRKGQELADNPHAALTFYWAELERQVRIEGTVCRTSQEKSEAYFRIRPKTSRLGALASHQSAILASRSIIETRMAQLEEQYAGTDDIPKPAYWGGYCVSPDILEFWQGRQNRLHDRIRYTRIDRQGWHIERLAP